MSELSREQVLIKLGEMCGAAATGRSVIQLRDELFAHDAALRAKLDDYAGAIEVMQSSRDILLRTFCLWQVDYQQGKMALRELPSVREQLAAAQARVAQLEQANGILTEQEKLQAQSVTTLTARLAQVYGALTICAEKFECYGLHRSALSGAMWCYPQFTAREVQEVQQALHPAQEGGAADA